MPDSHAAFWQLADALISEGKAERGTMMRMECLRTNCKFVAGVAFNGELLVKLSRTRVDELVSSGKGQAFAPAGKVFKEWVAFPAYDMRLWDAMIREACTAAT